jgi:hypothetical protein
MEIHAALTGPKASCHMNSAQLAAGRAVVDTTTALDHAAPDCASRQTCKTALAGQARGVFQGKILVRREAQKTDGYQMNQALLLSEEAEMDSKPQLEIYADDVKCSHGATIGALDADSLFYLRSRGVPADQVKTIILTASGGPFRNRQDLCDVTREEALRHPTWSMGKKISIDSATLMNKGLELIEACVLFDIDESRVAAVIHPESLIHGLVTCKNGGTLAHLAPADMRYPLRDVLFDEQRDVLPTLSFQDRLSLTFEPIDHVRFPAITLARAAYRKGQGACTVFNAANECAVAAFLQGSLPFLGISTVVERALDHYQDRTIKTLQDVLALDGEVRHTVKKTLFE